jgi:glycerophosphoryl diester phosphodiesterase
VRSLRFFAQTVFSSFTPARMRLVRDLGEDARIGVLADRGGSWTAAVALAEELGAEAIHPERTLVRPATVSDAHRLGLEVRAWPVNRPSDIVSLAALGLDGIFSDYPERLLHFTATRAANKGDVAS